LLAVGQPASHVCYKEAVVLPRAGDQPQTTSTECALRASKHNQALSENPSGKRRNRIVYVDGPTPYTAVKFPVAERTPVVAGNGKILGFLASSVYGVEINFGQHKTIRGNDHVMAFATRLSVVGAASGWIALSALLPSPLRTQFASVLAMDVQNTPELGDAPEQAKVVCDRPSNWGDGRLKVGPGVDDRKNKHSAATDYVRRPGGACYLLTNLPGHGGVAADILLDGDLFVPDAGVPRVWVPLYLPADTTDREQKDWDAEKLPHRMAFRYGRVGQRYGWIASADLR
jgi:hypothetical protein